MNDPRNVTERSRHWLLSLPWGHGDDRVRHLLSLLEAEEKEEGEWVEEDLGTVNWEDCFRDPDQWLEWTANGSRVGFSFRREGDRVRLILRYKKGPSGGE